MVTNDPGNSIAMYNQRVAATNIEYADLSCKFT